MKPMKKIVAVFLPSLILIMSLNGFAQTDNEIIKTLLGKDVYKVNNTLDSMGVWYYPHFHENTSTTGKEIKPKPYSIENGSSSVKVFILDVHPTKKFIQQITINYRHDNKGHIEDLKKIWTADDYHVGTYSTDVTYKFKK